MADASGGLVIEPVVTKADRKAFIDVHFRLNESDPNWVPPLRAEALEVIDPAKNPFFEHAEVQLFIARRDGEPVGRISAHFDKLAHTMPPEQGMGPGTGNWGLFDAADAEVAHALIAQAERWLKARGMTRILAPISMSIWEEPGLLTKGHDHPPTVLMGHDPAHYQPWVEAEGYEPAKTLRTYDLDVRVEYPKLIQRIISSGEKNERINVRRVDKSKFDEEAAIILDILNDAWKTNWGFVPITDAEVAYTGKKLKPLVREDLIMIAEYDGEPVAFMMTLPDLNKEIKAIGGKLFPFGFIRLLNWIRKPKNADMRVPLMGVRKELQSSRLASQLAFMMIEYIRRAAVADYGAVRGEIGWILDDNQGMNAIAEAIDADVNKEYTIYAKAL
ncbi:GNAT family N-acetyltransferase [Croceicoccus bisphenolivorans]|uniref:GNAT family N-acetyltransferase n=1 Tax=Croceicoccus bisphenolivorans TaxID=1783232 RepID=UPI00082E4F6A|nr:GNAT family N-acetyltransferase [Croceicoccus bisphenolivorans]